MADLKLLRLSMPLDRAMSIRPPLWRRKMERSQVSPEENLRYVNFFVSSETQVSYSTKIMSIRIE